MESKRRGKKTVDGKNQRSIFEFAIGRDGRECGSKLEPSVTGFIDLTCDSEEEMETCLRGDAVEVGREIGTQGTLKDGLGYSEQAKDEVKQEVKDEVKHEVKDEVRVEVKNKVVSEVKNEVKEKFEDEVKTEVKYEFDEATTAEEDSESVDCPICDENLVPETVEERIKHVEICLSLRTVDEMSQEGPSSQKIQDLNSGGKRGSLDDSSGQQKSPRLKKEPSHTKMKLKNKYVNKRIKISDHVKKEIKAPVQVKPTTRRLPIPELKILRFPMSTNDEYLISVDAFNFAPNDTISQYFLTHFHSDHYGGITKNWCYERVFKQETNFDDAASYRKIIYCSEITAKLLTLRFSVDPKFIKSLVLNKRYCVKNFGDEDLDDGGVESQSKHPGLYVTPITANHCPGAAIFLFESISKDNIIHTILHCGDFRVNREILDHEKLRPFRIENPHKKPLNKVYLDTTYMSPDYNFPKQELVCATVSEMFSVLVKDSRKDQESLFQKWFGVIRQSRITDFIGGMSKLRKKKFLILVGTYVIGKEKLALSILKRLNNCPIFVLNIYSREDKLKILKSFDDEYLNLVLVTNDLGLETNECIVHLVPMKIVGSKDEILSYFNHNKYFDHFEYCVGLRPTGWTFTRGPKRKDPNPVLSDDFDQFCKTQLNIMMNEPSFSLMDDILPQTTASKSNLAGKNEENCRIYTLPYSEHSSFRELSFLVIFLNIQHVIPTVNTHNPESSKRMNQIIKAWEMVRSLKLQLGISLDQSFPFSDELRNLSIDHF